jgi:hypothetical protein
MRLGVRKVVIVSSETTYGVCFAEGDKDFHGFPLEEDYDVEAREPSQALSQIPYPQAYRRSGKPAMTAALVPDARP